MCVFPLAGSPMVITRIFPAWNSSPEAVVYNGATIVVCKRECMNKIRDRRTLHHPAEKCDRCDNLYIVRPLNLGYSVLL